MDTLNLAALIDQVNTAGIRKLTAHTAADDSPDVLAMLERRSEERGRSAWERLGRPELEARTPSERYAHLRLLMLTAERARVLELRRSGVYPHSIISEVLEMLDVEESMLDAAADGTDALEPADAHPADHPDAAVWLPAAELCEHLTAAGDRSVPAQPECLDCLREGTDPVHLRMCLDCGNVGCCDSSIGSHATRHFHETGHSTMRSAEPRETWRWCYADGTLG